MLIFFKIFVIIFIENKQKKGNKIMNDLPRLSTSRIEHYLNLARNACYYSDYGKTRLGCIAVYKNKILSVGWNSSKTSPLQRKYNKYRDYDIDVDLTKNTIHAEINCLNKIKDLEINWSKVNVFVFRIKKDDSRGMARPCKGCMAFIKSLGIKNIYYSTDLINGWAYERINS